MLTALPTETTTETPSRTNLSSEDYSDAMTTVARATKNTEISTASTTAIKMCQHLSVIRCALYCLAYGNCASFHFDTDVYTQTHVSHNTSHHLVLEFVKTLP